MDANRFDTLTKSLTGTGTRRGLLRLLTAIPIAGGVVALLAPEDAAGQGNGAIVGGGGKRRTARHRHDPGKHKDNRKGKRTGRRTGKRKDKNRGTPASAPADCGGCPTCQTCNPGTRLCEEVTAGTACPAVACGSCDGHGACVGCTSAQDCLSNGTCATRCSDSSIGCSHQWREPGGTQKYCGELVTSASPSCSSTSQCDRGQFCGDEANRPPGFCLFVCTPDEV